MRSVPEETAEMNAESYEPAGPDEAAPLPAPAGPIRLSPADAPAHARSVSAVDPPSDARAAGPGRDVARLLVQSPHRLFFYWNFSRDPRPALRAALGEAAEQFRPAARLAEAGGEWEGEPFALADGEKSCWLDARPGRTYRAEAGFHAAGLPFIRVLTSDTVETPVAGISAACDPAPQFRIGEQEFERLLSGSGFTPAEQGEASEAPGPRSRTLAGLGLPSSSPRGTSSARRGDNF